MDAKEETPGVKGEFIVLDRTGDTKYMWDARNQVEVDAARKQFTELRSKGYLAYKVDKKGEKAEQVNEFDPGLERIIFAPAMVGG